MGHLIRMSNALVKFGEVSDQVRADDMKELCV